MRAQERVEHIAARANAKREVPANDTQPTGSTQSAQAKFQADFFSVVKALFRTPEEPPPLITVAEALEEQRLFQGLSLEAVAEIEGNPRRFPGVRIIYASRRVYPDGGLAPHALGYVGDNGGGGRTIGSSGRAGIELQYDKLLRGTDGLTTERLDRGGKVISSVVDRKVVAGRDLILTLDPKLQRAAQELLDRALERRIPSSVNSTESDSGGAILAIDVRNGAVLAAASAPRFDCAVMSSGDASRIEAFLADRGHPLFDRTAQMALPPGSVFKVLTSVALLHSPGFDPRKPWDCQGYLQTPDRRRCMLYRRQGIGHGPVVLVDALAQSCNTYFFHHAAELGPAPLMDWGRRFGFGERTSVDLPEEASGHLPTFASPAIVNKGSRETSSRDRPDDNQPTSALAEEAESLAIGQGALTATPLQVVRMMAAIANGGQLVTPHFAERLGLPASDSTEAADSSPQARASRRSTARERRCERR